ncbi:hypothetical protein ES711_08470 [Gelidibacter salicanalis]|uniref:Uncharacterized protein n=1 Tax=Gelidibacter salicanalis TaxID=291193 RepID=A0A5C7AIW9_9FLAO|nr:hypothetical protein [Gelidibacter salicanalis]TXE08528.1 hypothetical protein ES711_08470 [Gelidibacter salicanalis]
MKTILTFLLSSLFIVLSANTCDNQDAMTCEEMRDNLNEMKTTIQNLADTSVCNAAFECRSIALGSKPCGGPWGYLVYSTSIDTLKLSNLVATYNQQEKLMNTECGLISDCSFVSPPQQLECKNNRCIAIY